MKNYLLIVCLLLLPHFAHAATPGMQGYTNIKNCILQNDIKYCHSVLTPDSYALFDRFVSYKLMPCLPSDFNYVEEQTANGFTTVKTNMPAGGGKEYIFRLVFISTPEGIKLTIPETFRVGFGDKWQDKINLSEQLFLMMRQNMGNKLSCDTLTDLLTPHNLNK